MKYQDTLLTRTEAASLLGIKPETLATWAYTKRYNLPFVKVGRRVMYIESDIQNFIKERRQDTSNEYNGGDHGK